MSVNPSRKSPDQVPTRGSSRPRPLREPVQQLLIDAPIYAHPEYVYWLPEYRLIRDCIAGEPTIKAAGTTYLPAYDGMDNDDYALFLRTATFYNFTGRTRNALQGTIFRRRTNVEGVPADKQVILEKFTRNNDSFRIFSREVASELLTTDRVGVLCDYPAAARVNSMPYAVVYTAENIIDWDEGPDKDDRMVLTRVLLREYRLMTVAEQLAKIKAGGTASFRGYVVEWRELRMEGGQYVQQRWVNATSDAVYGADSGDAQPPVVVQRRGEPLDFIPFRIYNRNGKSPRPTAPPLQDIAHLNISHYRSYAALEHGRHYTGFPIYNVQVSHGQSAEYQVGPNRVWETPIGSKASLLEFNGTGLKSLENALEQKEHQAATLGGRMIGVKAAAVSESDNQLKLKERNEQALLLDVATAMDDASTDIVRWLLWMAGASWEQANKAAVEYNKDFLFDGAGAREFRAIHSMYKDGVLPITVVYEYFRKYEVIPDWMKLEEFKKHLDSLKEFPNQPDAEARFDGYPNKQSQMNEDEAERQREAEAEEARLAREAAEEAAARAAAEAERVREAQARQQQQQNQNQNQPNNPPTNTPRNNPPRR